MTKIKLGLIGAGARGAGSYAPYALKFPHEVEFTCVAEPITERRESFATTYKIPGDMVFSSWEKLIDAKPDLGGLIIANQDNQHFEPTMAALEQGYNILLEKPMAETIGKTTAMVELAEEKQRLIMVCHVLRYTPFFQKLKEVIDSGVIGEIKTIHHLENIGNWHFAHSFVRGNWRSAEQSTSMIVAKCCHDMDIVNFLMDKPATRLSSFGGLTYFKKENMPLDAAKTCVRCKYNKSCGYSAYNYIVDRPQYTPFRNIILDIEDQGELLKALEKTQYFRCVYQCDNDVADHQTVQIEYAGGALVNFTASAFSNDTSRQIKVMGTNGELEGKVEDNSFVHRDFASGSESKHTVFAPKTLHSGGDERIMDHFLSALRAPECASNKYGARLSLAGHQMAFAAEESRVNGGKVIEL